MQKYLDYYQQAVKKINAYNAAMSLFSWDSKTLAPSGCFTARAKHIGILSETMYTIQTDPALAEAVEVLCQNRDKLDEVLRHEVLRAKKHNDKLKKVPKEEFVAYSELLAAADQIYFEAKRTSNYALFAPTLEKILAYQLKYIKWQKTDTLSGYDILLDEYEEGMTTKEYDAFFDTLKERLVPFVKRVVRCKPKVNKAFLTKSYDVDAQREYTKYLRDVICFDVERGVIAESEHPFCGGTNNVDVRVATHYYENLFTSSIFSALHEFGHAIYEQQCDTALNDTLSGGGASMALHESQSRFYENVIGRSLVFWQTHFEPLKELFKKQLRNVSALDMYRAVNIAKPSFIRIEADELTYPLHIMVRYDIERKLMAGKLNVEKLPLEWNRLYKKYLGITVKNDSEGVLQDVHWASGAFGYFPTYALGSAYAAQIYSVMKKDVDVDALIMTKSLKGINVYLREKIHRFGATRSPKEIFQDACGQSFDPNYYVDYLIEKYSKVYELE